jgi:hypothetical protein
VVGRTQGFSVLLAFWDLDEFVAVAERMPGSEDVVAKALVVCRVNARH